MANASASPVNLRLTTGRSTRVSPTFFDFKRPWLRLDDGQLFWNTHGKRVAAFEDAREHDFLLLYYEDIRPPIRAQAIV